MLLVNKFIRSVFSGDAELHLGLLRRFGGAGAQEEGPDARHHGLAHNGYSGEELPQC